MERTLIIAEAGVNHNGSIKIAKQLAKSAKECGADIVKFQTFNVDGLVSKYAEMADYQKKNLGVQESQKDMLKKLMLTQEEFLELAGYCKEIGIRFLSTPFDIGSIHFLNPLQNIWKIPSGEITNYPYLVEIARTGKEVILSTGMSTMEEVEAAFNLLEDHGAGAITLLHCTTEYPAPMREINLRAMLTLKAYCGCKVGYSDHSEGIEVPVAAVAIGAKVIEKHFTLDKFMDGPDHKASLEPEELSAMVRAIRNVELALGSMEKKPSESERKNISVARKSIVAARRIKKGEILSKDNITTKRPGNGLDPMRWKEVIGTFAVREFQEDELIEI
ncbi:N-acetylneuraminate synthase [Schaedlerella arabinosiphila]|uniref:N-acetylneuraminate synthase n=1 Tax=Schaedlerella arabinosiphila TaxID=2044587 RepID=A0A9X5C6A9_9FIRM|nr:N-acetylneuraminate synthase [Schaedlerella arabinosiphila]KAI4443433.1 N,N'-diacetyllegionaminic acid synthase [Schaedlerella arabinosiphila]NDO68839.1 N-acetylneuraminate synthase [Schaedlerella arabinosiphila]